MYTKIKGNPISKEINLVHAEVKLLRGTIIMIIHDYFSRRVLLVGTSSRD